jgi:hypothetical protein
LDSEGKFWINTNDNYIFSFAKITSVEENNKKEIIFRSEYYNLNGKKIELNHLPKNAPLIKINYTRNNEIIETKNIIILE